MKLRGALMVCGATSDAGKSTIVAGMCRSLARRGVRVAPFKAQNMALNSFVTAGGHEIGRAQAMQAWAAQVEPEAAMNPILLKPTSERTSQVIVNGSAWRVLDAGAYHDTKAELWPIVLDALGELRRRFDVVLLEGAGSPAEINLLDRDIVNLRLAAVSDLPAIVAGDINLGGVFASLYGTVALLPDDLRACVHGFVINKFRGDPCLLDTGCEQLSERTGIPVLGVLPHLGDTGFDAEDSMALDGPVRYTPEPLADELDVAVIAVPRMSNFTDIEPLTIEPGVRVRYVHHASAYGAPDLVILPGSKATVNDLRWLRTVGLADRIVATDAVVLGVCAGYQMLGYAIDDPVESHAGRVEGLGLLPVTTVFSADKVTAQRSGHALGAVVAGYQIHHGRVRAQGGEPWLTIDNDGQEPELDGITTDNHFGTTLHGLFEVDEFRRTFLELVAQRRGKHFESAHVSFAAARDASVESLANAIDRHLDMSAIEQLVATAALVVP
jgi:adenosylcobyric acid synthase